MRYAVCALLAAWSGLTAMAATAADRPAVGPQPGWVQPAAADGPATIPGTGTGSDAALAVLLSDEQVRFTPEAVETYTERRIRIQTPQGLQAVGTIVLSWQPDADVITVHHLRVRRGAEVHDLLGNGKDFTVLRREDMLEQATLTGTLTAVLQPPDLQVGDIIEFAYTRRHADPVVPDRPDLQFAWPNTPIQKVHFRAEWPRQMTVHSQLRDFKPDLQEINSGDTHSVEFTLENPPALLQPTGAPARYVAMRRVELTAFPAWSDVSRRMAPLYTQAASLTADSPLHEEVARIRAASSDPLARAAAALRLAQDQIRYVLLAMNQGALVPATADQTWQRRYGDCKAKTALLLALLHELGIDAEPVAVNSSTGDGMDKMLPAIGAFDHVLVRAQIGGKAYWLDGTRLGDRNLGQLKIPFFGWGLPLVTKGAELVRIQPAPLDAPQMVQQVEVDASAGVDAPAPFHATAVFHGDSALTVKLSLDNADPALRDQGMRNFWRRQVEGAEVTKTTSSFDESSGTLTWTADGTLRMEWDDHGYYELDGMRLAFKADFARPAGTDLEAPYAVSYPEYTVTRVSVKLPPGNGEISIYGDNIDKKLAGREYKRTARLENSVFTAEASQQSLVPEISAKDAHAAESALREINRNGLYLLRTPQQPAAAAAAATAAAPAAPAAAAVIPSAAELQAQAGQPLASAAEYMQRAAQMFGRQMYEPALADLDHALALDPASARALTMRGFAEDHLGRLEEARATYEAAAKLDPEDAQVFALIAILAAEQGRVEDAADALSKSLSLRDDPLLHGIRGNAYMLLKKYDLAVPDFEAVIHAMPSEAASYGSLAMALIQLKRIDEARAIAAKVLDNHIGQSNGVLTAATIYALAGDTQEARKLLDGAIAKTPDTSLYFERALTQPDVNERIADLQRSVDLDGKNTLAVTLLVNMLRARKMYPELLHTLDQMEAASPPTGKTREQRAETLVHLGQPDAATEAYAAARVMAKGNAIALNSLCWSEATVGFALETALQDCDAALALKPDDAGTLDSRGLVLLKLGRHAEALASYDAALAQKPDFASSYFGRGIAKLRLGQTSDGEADLAAATKADPAIAASYSTYGVER